MEHRDLTGKYFDSFGVTKDSVTRLINTVKIGFIAFGAACSIGFLCCVTLVFFQHSTQRNLLNSKDLNLTYPPHPYNVCLQTLIDQANREGTKTDLDKIKSVCFELMQNKERAK